MAEGAGMLEASPAALAIVITFFLVFTLGFEHALHWARGALLRRRKMGLLAALNKFSSEIMLLGVATLLLSVCEDNIDSICVQVTPAGHSRVLKPWLSHVTGTREVQGCACCLAKTQGVTPCFLESKGCPELPEFKEECQEEGLFRGIKHQSDVLPASNSSSSSTSYPAAAAGGPEQGRRLLAEAAATGAKEQCNGPMQVSYEECGHRPGYAPAVTVATLHQVHMLLFVMAVTHVLIGAVALLISTAKLKYYARRGGGEAEDALAVTAIQAAQTAYDATAAAAAAFSPRLHSGISASTAAAAAASGLPGDAAGAAVADTGLLPSAFAAAAAATTSAPSDSASSSVQRPHSGGGGRPAPVATVTPWSGRPDKMTPRAWLVEAVVYFVRQVALFNTVSRQEYSVLRASFYLTHAHVLAASPATSHPDALDAALESRSVSHGGAASAHGDNTHNKHAAEQQHGRPALPPPPVLHQTSSFYTLGAWSSRHPHGLLMLRPEQAAGAFPPYFTESVERDGAAVVGLGLPMFLLLILFTLVSGVIGWATWLFLAAAGALLLAVNLVLLSTLRHMTQGGHVTQQQQAWYHWLHRKNLMLGCIKLTLFFFSFVISNAVFMAIFFGPESCFFSRTGFQRNPVPWWAIMLVVVGLLLNLSLFTLPIYSLTAHTLKVDRALLQSTVRDRLYQQACADYARNNKQHGGATTTRGLSGTLARMRSSLSMRRSAGGSGSGAAGAAAGSAAAASGAGGLSAVLSEVVSDDTRWQELQEAMSV